MVASCDNRSLNAQALPPTTQRELRNDSTPTAVADCYNGNMSSPPTRLPDDLYDAAKSAAAVSSRSAAQQIAYWARVGRELEASPGVSQRDIGRVLAGDGSYDALSEREQAIVRAEWDERVASRRTSLNFEDAFTATGESWSEVDDDGNLVTRSTQRADA